MMWSQELERKKGGEREREREKKKRKKKKKKKKKEKKKERKEKHVDILFPIPFHCKFPRYQTPHYHNNQGRTFGGKGEQYLGGGI